MHTSFTIFSDPESLIKALQQENRNAQSYLYKRCKQVCFHYAEPRTKLSRDVLEDILQDAVVEFFMQLRNRRYVYEGIPPEQYVKRIFWFKCVDYWRKTGKEMYMSENEEFFDNLPADDSIEAEEREQRLGRVTQILNQLDEKCLKFVTLFYFHSKSIAECGKALNMTPESAKVKRHRCIEKLRNFVL